MTFSPFFRTLPKRLKRPKRIRKKAVRAWAGGHWLSKWYVAEERVKKAKHVLRSIKARINIQRNRYGLPATRTQLHNRVAAEEELRVAKAAELKFMTSFAHVQRWAIEEGKYGKPFSRW